MGFLKNIFGDKTSKEVEEAYLSWTPLVSVEEIDTIKEISKNQSVLIFKHSTRCGISRMVIKQFESLFNEENKQLKVYYLDLLNFREVSSKLSEVFQVIHQSPQLLVIKNGISVYDESHYEITKVNLSKYM
ncbi:MAG: bacillithiol system redox-active protein YtxJ [Candidatus Arcticimaribacter sp.]|nr:bacillithiol system redox-active protein YtxJ [Flavobacteriaceae bacterium]PSR08918.1 MAG: bacillithiol system redox-active protein YtxJ [Candidatus Arcticimaribacter sp.]PTM02370.1 MAG: bacillithiol system redox-active protein YtxJ [Candidatus Arcticimaribacter sp.]